MLWLASASQAEYTQYNQLKVVWGCELVMVEKGGAATCVVGGDLGWCETSAIPPHPAMGFRGR